MKETGKITRISIGPGQQDNFCFLGIVTSEPDYRLSSLLNKKLGISLKHFGKEATSDNKNGSFSFSGFATTDQDYSLVPNKSGAGFLIRKLEKIDFFFIPGSNRNSSPDSIATSVRELPGITAVFILHSEEIKDKNIEILRHIAG